MSRFAVIDTETTWRDEVMSIGIAIADSADFKLIDKRYYILLPFKNHGGMYSGVLYAKGIKPDLECERGKAIDDIKSFLVKYDIDSMFAYNALFDYGHLPELHYLKWYDIMKLASNQRYNTKIPKDVECYKTGRLKRGYGVENIYRILSGNSGYNELHNAIRDSVDELEIMRMMGVPFERYDYAMIKNSINSQEFMV